MASILEFEDLDCWKMARELVNTTYILCRNEQLRKDYEL